MKGYFVDWAPDEPFDYDNEFYFTKTKDTALIDLELEDDASIDLYEVTFKKIGTYKKETKLVKVK